MAGLAIIFDKIVREDLITFRSPPPKRRKVKWEENILHLFVYEAPKKNEKISNSFFVFFLFLKEIQILLN